LGAFLAANDSYDFLKAGYRAKDISFKPGKIFFNSDSLLLIAGVVLVIWVLPLR